jgi:1-piperideine-2-carboxylate/1-pyrroline-2-carboxylate reductase [NAD(P)H]
MRVLDAAATVAALPWQALADAVARTLDDLAAGLVQAPERWVLPVAPGTSWFLMPAWTAPEAGGLAAIKLITYAAANPARGLPAIQGDVLVLHAATGERLALLDGPTVTARRTAAVSLLAAQRLAARPAGPLLVIGPGVQGEAHALAFAAGLGVREVWVAGRRAGSADALVARLAAQGLDAHRVDDLDAALARCPLVVTATPAQAVCLSGPLLPGTFVAAVGAFTPQMIELAPALTRQIADQGSVLIDSAAARHEAGDLLAAGLDMARLPTLADRPSPRAGATVLFKSCGSALWDLAAARCAVQPWSPDPGDTPHSGT